MSWCPGSATGSPLNLCFDRFLLRTPSSRALVGENNAGILLFCSWTVGVRGAQRRAAGRATPHPFVFALYFTGPLLKA